MTKEIMPLPNNSVFSQAKLDFLGTPRINSAGVQQSYLELYMAIIGLPRPTNPKETIGYGYSRQSKFHDGELELMRREVKKLESNFFTKWPRRKSSPITKEEERAALGEIAKHIYKNGAPSYPKPNLRKNSPMSDQIIV